MSAAPILAAACAIIAVGICILVRLIVTAREGYQDATGFHYGSPLFVAPVEPITLERHLSDHPSHHLSNRTGQGSDAVEGDRGEVVFVQHSNGGSR